MVRAVAEWEKENIIYVLLSDGRLIQFYRSCRGIEVSQFPERFSMREASILMEDVGARRIFPRKGCENRTYS